MEEKLSDHGLDHPFFLNLILIKNFLILNFILISSAFATSFGPIPLVEQIEHSPYVIRGYIESRWVDLDKQTNRPYTYYRFRVEEQLQGRENVGSSTILKSPGGEYNGVGYHIPARADFNEGEHVIVMARSTPDGSYEVFGLASGKYTVEDKNGKTVIRNGLGPLVADANGHELNLDEFRALIDRAKNDNPTSADLGVIVNKDGGHDGHSHDSVPNNLDSTKRSIAQNDENTGVKNLTPALQDKSLTDRSPSSEKSEGLPEDLWIKIFAIGLVVFAFLLVAVFAIRKPSK